MCSTDAGYRRILSQYGTTQRQYGVLRQGNTVLDAEPNARPAIIITQTNGAPQRNPTNPKTGSVMLRYATHQAEVRGEFYPEDGMCTGSVEKQTPIFRSIDRIDRSIQLQMAPPRLAPAAPTDRRSGADTQIDQTNTDPTAAQQQTQQCPARTKTQTPEFEWDPPPQRRSEAPCERGHTHPNPSVFERLLHTYPV